MGGSRPGHIRITRPTALLSAVVTLFAALFLCLGTDPGGTEDHHPDGPVTATAANGTAYSPAAGTTVRAKAEAKAEAEARYTCPYDKGDCGLFPHQSPAVLTVPPPATPLAGDVLPAHLEPPYPTGQVPRSGALARAPDLHVLQVLRT
ncbi:hypothetical protein OIE62_13545 [Streptomyces scopuliridis]|uniref:Uncharacterized protein n=1 Tax=Streptomyces scopuliridis TaxID=452529 RepID=A0ACD4ZQY0_9ACTN|nr:hypothetical protein [Streptomyces scopuliridis]WSB36143.1 hypothetical protein OG949_27100 [Streptomyces scopuliridis]WSC00437.1 hypothetical protein OG835_27850 [Streptomyces scopuliridis]WSC05951.1 hypothetical protein OIE62_13545 [Streptomyces scopuliridis]